MKPRAVWSEQSPERFIFCPPDGLCLSTATLIFPAMIDSFSLLQTPGFVSRVGKVEVFLLLEKEHLNTCGTPTALFVRD